MKMKKRDITVEDLREMIVKALESDGWSDQEVAGYVTAQEHSGWLRPKCPAWLRNSAAVWYLIPPANGFGYPEKKFERPKIKK